MQVAAAAAPAGDAAATEFFEKEVRPLLVKECYSCHSGKLQQGGLRVDSREWLLKGGSRGTALVPGNPKKSLLVQVVHHDELVMPPGRKLADKQIGALEKWVQLGAPWPESAKPAAGPVAWDEIMRVRKQWWSLQPLRKPAVPTVKDAKWSAQPVDRFILAELEKKGLRPAARADRRTLARRVYLTLTGLPPSPQEVESFVNDKSPKAYENLVDRMLASPHYGETWARHWMDVVRFNETHGYEWNHEIRDVWRYRDYLIRAFNQDVPFDALIREHIAGDLIPNPRSNPKEHIKNESEIATAFYRFGEVGHDVFKEIGLDHLDNQIDTVAKAFQGTTLSCARCHDHKLDAIPQKDYYGMLGILASSRQVIHTLDDETVNAQPKSKVRDLKRQVRQELGALWQTQAAEAGRYLHAAQAARDKAANAADLAKGLDAARLTAWTTALEKKGAGLEDPLTPWQTAADAARANGDVAAAWKSLGEKYTAENRQRAEFNAKTFTPWGDFSKGVPEGWRGDGLALQDGPSPAGDFALSPDGKEAITGIYPAGFYTHVLSEKLNGSFQSAYLPDKKFVTVEVMGEKSAAARFIPDFRLLQDGGSLKQPLKWQRFSKSEREERGYIELCTKLDNIRYPGWGGGDKDEPFKDPHSFFGVTRAYISDSAETPKDELSDVKQLFSGDAANLDAVGDRYAKLLEKAVADWAQGQSTDEGAKWLDWLVQHNLVSNAPNATPKLAELVNQYRETEKSIQPARVVAGLADLDGFDHAVYLRGDVTHPGDVVHRRYLEMLSSTADLDVPRGSGRLQLAERIADPKNPLTGRVFVNRVWHTLFGTGIVRSTDDFGHMGDQPSHPALLDYLATKFVANQPGGQSWSVKQLIRSILLTETFQMSSVADPKAALAEPENRLLHHFPARRLEAEAIRDSILAVSGRLDLTLYGPSIQPYRTEPMPERRLFPGPLDGNGRRSIYTKVTLMQGPKFLEVFNFPDPKVAVGRRDVTNVPAQALTLLNDPFVLGQADLWAEKLILTTDSAVSGRVERMFLTALGRRPTAVEADRFNKLVEELAKLHEVPAGEELKNRALWKDVAHSVFNLKEFIYVR